MTSTSTPAPTIADWRPLAASKRAALAQKIPPDWLLPSFLTSTISEASTQNVLSVPGACGLLSERELDLTTDYDATALVELMATRKAKSAEVVQAFCKRAAIAQQCTNCLTEIMFEEAMARARECDGFLEGEGRVMGPLHGLPVSLKDSFNVKGTQATVGYIANLSLPPAASNSTLVDLLLAAGAVFYCKTNLPQTMMTADSHNNIHGRTLNPHNLSLTPGGSTGGEGALLAMRGSILGMATDIAGSCRIPALCCGVKAFKPSASRVPFGGGVPPGRIGSPSPIAPVIGPVGRSVRDAELIMRTICTGNTWMLDENVLHAPWRRVDPVTRPLRFGLIRGHAKRPLHPPIARALHSAATKLKEMGHQIILLDDQIPDLYETAILAWKFFKLDPKKTAIEMIRKGGEPAVPSLKTAAFKELEGWEASLDELWDMNVNQKKVVKRYHEIFVGQELDAVVMPGYQATAVPHDTYGVTVYTVLQNLINYPSGILPYLKAEKELDQAFFKSDAAYEPPYAPETFEGMPAHVQVMGKPMQDEELIEILKVVEGILAE
ncbi:amidase [Lentithecium fluviatile CBS 122367]|uniref:Amidase n=1 Tax=Lentithecium fluviatile CBS 122367 TaxID=1168545 RepID=A0A6G1JD04_9PLEO|nr:amidase [Lentithecium fluviatile CBS 122367]